MVIIISIYCIVLISSLIFHSYQKTFIRSLSKKEYHLLFLFPLSLMIADTIFMFFPEKCAKGKEKMRALYVFEDSKSKNRTYMAQVIAYVIGILLLFNTFALAVGLMDLKDQGSTLQETISRPGYGQKGQKETYQVSLENQETHFYEEVDYVVSPRNYTEETFHQAVEESKEKLLQQLLGENTAADHITKPLHLVKKIPSKGMTVKWIRDNKELVENDGSIQNKTITEQQEITVTAVINCGEFEEEYEIPLIIYPYQASKEEDLLSKINMALNEADEKSRTENTVVLPETIDGKEVYFYQEKKQRYITFLCFGMLFAVMVPILWNRKWKEKLEHREEELRMDYPELVNKLVLLVEAGMTVTRAWAKIATDYETAKNKKGKSSRYVYEEMVASYYELKNGVSESQVFDGFGRRIKLAPYMKLSSLLAQNSTKGMEGILNYMKAEAVEAFSDRKELAKRLGEKAGTKMLLPMGLMLGVVFVVIIIPAFTVL